jgi:hypothetical protein
VWTLGFRDASFSVACEYFSGESNGSVSLTVHRRFDSITDFDSVDSLHASVVGVVAELPSGESQQDS